MAGAEEGSSPPAAGAEEPKVRVGLPVDVGEPSATTQRQDATADVADPTVAVAGGEDVQGPEEDAAPAQDDAAAADAAEGDVPADGAVSQPSAEGGQQEAEPPSQGGGEDQAAQPEDPQQQGEDLPPPQGDGGEEAALPDVGADTGGDETTKVQSHGGEATDTVEELEIPDTQLEVGSAPAVGSGDQQTLHATGALREAMQAQLADFANALGKAPQGALRDALSGWSSKLNALMEELSGILDSASRGEVVASAVVGEDGRHFLPGLDAGGEAGEKTSPASQEAADAWPDPEVLDKEISDLKRLRREIRSVFKHIQTHPDSDTKLQVDDFESARTQASSEHGECQASMPSPGKPRHDKKTPARARGGVKDVVSNASEDSEQLSPTVRVAPKQHEVRREHAEPEKHWNWTDEVLKASLNPQNQWDFSGRGGGTVAPMQNKLPSWEQPRQVAPMPTLATPRAVDIAAKARERAEQVMRTERELQKRHFGGRAFHHAEPCK